MINLIVSRCFTHGLLLCFILLHISNGSVSASLVGHILYSADLMSATCISHLLLMIHRYIYSRYSLVFLTLYQLYHSLPSSTLISSSSLYLKLQPELLLKVVTYYFFNNILFLLSFSTLFCQSGCLLKLLAFPILDPGTCLSMKSNWDRYRAHCACL